MKKQLKSPPKMQKHFLESKPKIAIIGGSGLEDPRFFKKIKEIKIKTPFGYPSAPISIGDFSGKSIAFLSRHGKAHGIPPHKVNSRANLWALKELGVDRVIGVSAVGSLQKSFRPGDIVICDQFIDFTKKRDYSFYDGSTSSPQVGTVHVSLADPFCEELRNLFYKEAKRLNIAVHNKGAYWCIEGPRFSTRAESKFFRNFADIIGMTLVPEVSLARELGICYLTLAMVTDYDVWQPHPVSIGEILKTMKANVEKIKKLLGAAIPKIKGEKKCPCQDFIKDAKI